MARKMRYPSVDPPDSEGFDKARMTPKDEVGLMTKECPSTKSKKRLLFRADKQCSIIQSSGFLGAIKQRYRIRHEILPLVYNQIR